MDGGVTPSTVNNEKGHAGNMRHPNMKTRRRKRAKGTWKATPYMPRLPGHKSSFDTSKDLKDEVHHSSDD